MQNNSLVITQHEMNTFVSAVREYHVYQDAWKPWPYGQARRESSAGQLNRQPFAS